MGMKVWLIATALVMNGLGVFAQEGFDHYTNYYAVEGGIIASSSGLGFGPTFSVYRSGHKIDSGLGIKFYDVWKDGPGILGTYLGYKFYPNQRKNNFSLYFGYHNVFSSHNTKKRLPIIYDEVADKRLSPTYSFILENLVGIGFDFQMGNKFIWFTDFSVGAVLEWNEFSDNETRMEVRSTGLIRTGIGYIVGSKRAK